jgi:hypothetical protein
VPADFSFPQLGVSGAFLAIVITGAAVVWKRLMKALDRIDAVQAEKDAMMLAVLPALERAGNLLAQGQTTMQTMSHSVELAVDRLIRELPPRGRGSD